MIIRSVCWIVLVFAVLALLVGISRAMGLVQPTEANSWTARLESDTQLQDGVQCWRAICPGTTSIDGVMGRLNEYTYQTFPSPNIFEVVTYSTPLESWLYIRGKPTSFLTRYLLFRPRDLDVGTALLHYGLPSAVYTLWNEPLRAYEVHLCYEHEVCVFSVTDPLGQLKIWNPISVIYYERGEMDRLESDRTIYRGHWRGFAAYGWLR